MKQRKTGMIKMLNLLKNRLLTNCVCKGNYIPITSNLFHAYFPLLRAKQSPINDSQSNKKRQKIIESDDEIQK